MVATEARNRPVPSVSGRFVSHGAQIAARREYARGGSLIPAQRAQRRRRHTARPASLASAGFGRLSEGGAVRRARGALAQ